MQWTRGPDPENKPSGRIGHVAAAMQMERAGVVYIQGGKNVTNFFSDLWRFNVTASAWEEIGPDGFLPEERIYHTASLSDEFSTFAIYGGMGVVGGSRTVFEDIAIFDMKESTWRDVQTEGETPGPRHSHVAITDNTGKCFIHAGFDASYAPLGDLWSIMFNIEVPQWSRITPVGTSFPLARGHHSSAFDQSTATIYIFGGYQTRTLNDVWTYSLQDNSWTEEVPSYGRTPDDRQGHVSWVDPTNHTFYVHGGTFYNGFEFGDTWAFQNKGKVRKPTGKWSVMGDGCEKRGKCIQTVNYPNTHTNEACNVTIDGALELYVVGFDTEQGQDILRIGPIFYSGPMVGGDVPLNGWYTENMGWLPDNNTANGYGWKICANSVVQEPDLEGDLQTAAQVRPPVFV